LKLEGGIRAPSPLKGSSPAASKRRTSSHLPALTGLRFFLALWVILHHLTGKGMMMEGWLGTLPAAAQSFVRGGYLAVGTFFVLSGFVLARSYRSTKWDGKSLLKYAAGRVGRVYPAYLLSLLIVSPFIYDFLFSNTAGSVKAITLTSYGFVLQGWLPSYPPHWNTPAWSLSCEFFFYLCFPVAAMFFVSPRWTRIASAIALAFGLPLIFAYAMHLPATLKPLYHLGDFLLGIAAAGIFEWMETQPSLLDRGYWFYLPATLAGVLIIAFPEVSGTHADLNSTLRPFNGLLLLGLALGGGVPARVLSTSAAGFLGRASYCMYILHIPMLWWYKRTAFYKSGVLSSTVFALVYVALVIAVSGLTCEYFEEPANHRIRRWVSARLAA
jgi:peptidoglycan/LPS O-acetylase OafA/YrhL